jgi:TRAP-type C4-dicarboxylate transport system substrate-binding protein
MTGHFKAFVGLAMGRTYWDTLPKDVQKVLLDEAKKAGDKLTELTIKSQEAFKEKFRAQGVTFVEDVDAAAFQKATESVYKAFPKWSPGLHDKIKKILAQ